MGERLGVILSPVDGIGFRNIFGFPNHPGILPGIKLLRHGQPTGRAWPVSAADAGTFTSTAATTPGTATDTKKAWVVNSLTGGLIVTSDGKFLQIASNTATVATGTAAWTGGAPAATATYYIVPALLPAPAAGMTLRPSDGTSTAVAATTMTDSTATWVVNAFTGFTVTSGGKTAVVTSNTATVLTFASWTGGTPPTGKYTITSGTVLAAGTYMLHYTYAYDTGATNPPVYETGPSPPVQVTLAATGEAIMVRTLPALPSNVTAVRFYLVRAPLGPPQIDRGYIQQVTSNADFQIVTNGDGTVMNNYNGTECMYPNEQLGGIQVPALKEAYKVGNQAIGAITAATALDTTITDAAIRNLGKVFLTLKNGTTTPAGGAYTTATLKSIADNASMIVTCRSPTTTLGTDWVVQWLLDNLGVDGTWAQFTVPNTMVTANSRIFGAFRYGKTGPTQNAMLGWEIVSLNPGVDFHVGFYNLGPVPITDQHFVWDYEIVN